MKLRSERGSLSLEQVLFISAIVLITTGIGAFYGSIGKYFSDAATVTYTQPTVPTAGSNP